MRDLVLALFLIGIFPVAISRPFIGLLVYLFLSVASPHRLTWGFAYEIPWAQLFAIPLIFSVILRGDYSLLKQLKHWSLPLLLLGWAAMTTLFSLSPEVAGEKLSALAKLNLGCLLILAIVKTPRETRITLLVIAMSIGIYGFKGAIFMMSTGGIHRVAGPPESNLGDNNALALALIVVTPILAWAAMSEARKLLRGVYFATVAASILSAVGTYSRGGFLGLATVLTVYIIRSGSILRYGLMLVPVIAIALNFMPEQFWQRINSINDYQTDNSSLERLHTWQAMYNLANDRLTGGGFSAYTNPASVLPYAPTLDFPVRAAHSNYFQVLGDHGWIGLTIFLLIIIATFVRLQRIIKRARKLGDTDTRQLGYALQASILAYCVSGTFLSMAYWEAAWYLIAVIVTVARNEQLAPKPSEEATLALQKQLGRPLTSTTRHAKSF
jgi:probable O-glycosylation ligase (exosortase A-associated)